jgi:hypothetical protein
MSPSQIAVQAGHTVAEYLLKEPYTEWSNGTLIYLGVRDEHQLKDWMFKLNTLDIKFTTFREPDIGNQVTAIASLGNSKVFKNLRLL